MEAKEIKIPVPYKGLKYEMRINHVLRPNVGYHVRVFRNGEYVMAIKGVVGTIEDAKKEGSRMIVLDYNTKASADAQSDANLATAQEKSPYGKGTIKLTWTDTHDNNIIRSEMFDSLEEALKNTYDKKRWLVFKLTNSGGDKYEWELLPYGYGTSYKRTMYFADKPILKLVLFGLAATGAYFIGKAIYNRLKNTSVVGDVPVPTPTPTI